MKGLIIKTWKNYILNEDKKKKNPRAIHVTSNGEEPTWYQIQREKVPFCRQGSQLVFRRWVEFCAKKKQQTKENGFGQGMTECGRECKICHVAGGEVGDTTENAAQCQIMENLENQDAGFEH